MNDKTLYHIFCILLFFCMCVSSVAQEETNNQESTTVEKTTDEQKQSEVAPEDKKSTEDTKSDEKATADKEPDEKTTEDTKSTEKTTEDTKSDEKATEDTKSDEKTAEDTKSAEKTTEDAKSNESKAAETKAQEKTDEPVKETKKEEKKSDTESKDEGAVEKNNEKTPPEKSAEDKENTEKSSDEKKQGSDDDGATSAQDGSKNTADGSTDQQGTEKQQTVKDENANAAEAKNKQSVKELLATLPAKVGSLEKLEKIWEESSKSEEDLYAIVNFLSLIDAPNKKVIYHMIALTKSKYEKVRKVALDRLLEIIPTLIKIKIIDNVPSDEDFVNILSNFDSDMSVAAMLMEYSKEEEHLNALILKSLINMGTKSLDGIIRFLRISPSEKIKNVAIEVSYGVGVECIPMIIPLLGDLNPFIQDFAKRALKKFDDKTLASLTKYIQTATNKENIALAITVIGDMGEKAKDTVPILVKYLKKEGATQLAATRALKNMGMHAYVALDDLISNLRSDDWQVRQASAETIGNFGEQAKKAVSPLMSQFRREDYGIVRSSICRQFGRIGKPAKDSIRLLIEALNDEDEIVIKSASESLGDFGKSAEKAIQPLTRVLIYYDVKEREAAAKALAKIGRRSVSVLTNMLNFHDDPAGREGAAMALGYLGPQARRSVRTLTKALKFDEAEIVKIAAADALGKIGDRYAIHALIDAVRNGTVIIREVATSSLVKIGSAAVIDITRALKRPGTEARVALVYILGELGRNAIPAVGTLNSCLDSWRDAEREQLIKTLGKIGANNRSPGTLNRFVELMKETQDENERRLLSESLKQFGEMSISYVIPLLKSDSEEIVSQAKSVIEHLIKEAFPTLEKIVEKGDDEILTARSIEILSKDEKSLPILLKKFKHESSLVRNTTKDSIIKNIGEKAISGLISILQNTASSVERKVVGDTLAGIGKSAVDSLVLVISNSDKQKARLAAIDAVSQIGPKARNAIPVLQESIKIRRGEEQSALARCLGSIGTQAIPKILELLEHNDSSVQNAAIDALGETGAKDSISHLLSSLKNERLLSLVIKAMVKMPELAVPTLISSLQHQNHTVRFACAAALFEIAPAKAIAPLAQRSLVESDPMVKYMLQTALDRCQNILENKKSSDQQRVIQSYIDKYIGGEYVPYFFFYSKEIMNINYIFLFSLIIVGCANVYIAPGQEVSHPVGNYTQTMYIAGDFGTPSSLLKDVTESIAKDARQQQDMPYIIGLGDNLYVKGLPRRAVRTSKPFAKLRKIAKLFAQCRYKDKPIPLITIPGNHDYNDDAVSVERDWGNIAPWYFLSQMEESSTLFKHWSFVPGDITSHSSASELYEYLYSDLRHLVAFMKPKKIPTRDSSTAIIAVDSELIIDLFAAGYYDLAKKYLQSLKDVLEENKNHKWVILLAHHPLASYAKHRPGKWGSFLLGPGWPQFSQWWHKVLMIPPLGTLTTFGWWAIHYPQDIHSCAYENYRSAVCQLLKDNNVSLVVSGHEHCTQLIDLSQAVAEETPRICMQLVCGEAAKEDPVTSGEGTLFFHTGGGYSQIKFFEKQLLIEMKDRKGKQLYNYVINK